MESFTAMVKNGKIINKEEIKIKEIIIFLSLFTSINGNIKKIRRKTESTFLLLKIKLYILIYLLYLFFYLPYEKKTNCQYKNDIIL